MSDERHDPTDEQFERWLAQAAQDYNRPGEVPRDLMWARIQAERRAGGRAGGRRKWIIAGWALAAAAVLALVFGLGWWSANEKGSPAPRLATAPVDSAAPTLAIQPSTVIQIAAVEHFAQTEIFLTELRTEADSAPRDYSTSARRLLTNTRLLLDSPALTDTRLRTLLQDLELTLAQIAQLEAERGTDELGLITDGLEARGVLPRLRSAIPAGPARIYTQGES